MAEVNVRELRNHGGDALERVARGETLTVTRAGVPVAELRPLPRQLLSAATLIAATSEEPRQAHVQQAEADFDPLPFDAAAARAFGRIAASLRRAGRKPSARAYDAMIAAIAIAKDLPLYTCNPDDFTDVEELQVTAVSHPEQS